MKTYRISWSIGPDDTKSEEEFLSVVETSDRFERIIARYLNDPETPLNWIKLEIVRV